MSNWKGRGGGRAGSQPTLSDSTSSEGDSGAALPTWAGRGGGRSRPQPKISSATVMHLQRAASNMATKALSNIDSMC